ncbi:type II toxin-antitoxin system VapC family toxin [Sphingobium sp. AR-3-1]|uniref:Type II toxin-antitoxin system VapC family toxin n=1 Tax=Sphingobium psychrophilum TaxID=2728834 RepID=A0A7X9WUG8_9SPHN|nr:type II toxin-antitoxin system VapC family toxin [Sphingobium psychrophilum]NML10068.1 type II toxin-antitoxin system VapC family toxin [Sphingobium psychrophilum]
MKAVDTNILARAMIRDDANQAGLADSVLASGAYVPLTVFLETAWLLSSRYQLSRSVVADTLIDILDLPNVSVEEGDVVQWAIERYRHGGDIADALHIVASIRADSFVTFDRGVLRKLGDSPLPIEVLK